MIATMSLPSFQHQLTPHFRLGEFALNRPERAFTEKHQIETALRLARFGEHVRDKFGGPVIITSGYRPPIINRQQGGDVNSEHLYKQPAWGAMDFYLPHVDMVLVQRFCEDFWAHSVGRAAFKLGFVHLGMGWGNPKARWDY